MNKQVIRHMPDFIQIQVQLTIPQYLQWMMYKSMTFKGVDISLSKGGKNIQTKRADVNISTFSHSVTVQQQS
jgi:hypothetical protein